MNSTTALETKEIKKGRQTLVDVKQDLDISNSMRSRYKCSDSICNSNGRCYKFYGGFVCFCQDGFIGKYCEMTLTISTLKTKGETTTVKPSTTKSTEYNT